MDKRAELRDMTESLLALNDFMLQRFEQAKESNEKGDFYSEVKPFADRVLKQAEAWEGTVVSWLKSCPRKNLHPKQITATAENIQMVSVQAFFPQTSRKRFIGHIQSIEYVLRSVISAVEQEEQNEEE